MDVLTTRMLTYPKTNGDTSEVLLTVYMPFEAKENQWKCGAQFDPPIYSKIVYGVGVDFIQAFVGCLKVARIFLETTKLFGSVHWDGMFDCGLPSHTRAPVLLDTATKPPAEPMTRNMDVLTTRMLSHPNERGIATEYPLTIFAPFRADSDTWKCGFTLGAHPSATPQYGVGADYIEALLDGLATARLTFESEVPPGWTSSDDLLDCTDFPVKVGRSFYTDLSRDRPLVDPGSSPD